MNKKYLIFVWFFVFVFSMSKTVAQLSSQEQQLQQIDPFEQAVKDSSSSDPYVRRRAAEQFGSLRDTKAVIYLRKMLKDENPFVRQTAVDSLGLLRAKEVVNDIIELLKTDKETQVRQSAIVALGYIGDPSCVDTLIEILKDENEPAAVKYSVCNTLGILRSTQAVSSLQGLINSEDLNLRRSVIYTLSKIANSESISILRDAIDTNINNEQILIDLLKILADLNDNDSVAKFKLLYSTTTTTAKIKFYSAYGLAKVAKDKTVLPTIKAALKSKDESIKNNAIDAIRFIGDSESLILLKEMQKTETSPYTKQLLSMAIKQLETKYPNIQQRK